MAKDKASFVLYSDLIHTIEKLSDARAGKLLKVILQYVNDKNPPEPTDKIIGIAFEPIKQQLKRDLKKWDKYIKKQSDNGKRGGRPLKDKTLKTQKTQPFFQKPKKADSVSVSVNGSVIWNTVKENFFNAFEWQEKFIRDKKIGPKALVDKMHEFINDIELREDYKGLKDLKNHFTNLFNKNGKQYVGTEQHATGPKLKIL